MQLGRRLVTRTMCLLCLSTLITYTMVYSWQLYFEELGSKFSFLQHDLQKKNCTAKGKGSWNWALFPSLYLLHLATRERVHIVLGHGAVWKSLAVTPPLWGKLEQGKLRWNLHRFMWEMELISLSSSVWAVEQSDLEVGFNRSLGYTQDTMPNK